MAEPRNDTQKPQKKSREQVRFDREAKALQKNLEKRKKQQQAREELKANQNKENNHGQD